MLEQQSTTKVCPCCGETKELISFCKDKSTKDGLNCYCRKCCADKQRKLTPEQSRAYARRYRAKHPEQVKAKQDRENVKYGKEKSARWRAKHPEREKATRQSQREKMRKLVADYKQAKGCRACGITDPRVLDLHHMNGADKILAVSQMIARFGVDDVRKEMAKCHVLCANCHRIEHYEHMQRKAGKVQMDLFR